MMDCEEFDLDAIKDEDFDQALLHGVAAWLEANTKFVIRFPLTAIKGIGDGVAQIIVNERNQRGPYRSIWNLCERLAGTEALNRNTIERLIVSGALDSTGARRSQMMAVLDSAIAYGKKTHEQNQTGQFSML